MGLLTGLKVFQQKIAGFLIWKTKRVLYTMQGKRVVHLLHIGKTGGTALKHALSPFLINDRYVICLHSHGIHLRDIPQGEGVIFFLRDPIDRFVSGFYSRQRQGQPRHFRPWNADEQIAFQYFDSPIKLASCLSSSDDGERKLAEDAMRSIRHVKSHYWDWLGDEHYLLSRAADIIFIGFQESLADDFERLKAMLALPKETTLPEDDVQAHRSPAYLDRGLDVQSIENLREWYQEDYRCIAVCQKIYLNQNVGRKQCEGELDG